VINGEEVDLISNESLVYAKADFDPEIILKGDFNVLITMCGIGGEYNGVGLVNSEEEILELYKSIQNLKEAKGWANLSSVQRKFYNHLNWLSMHRKATILIRAYIQKIVPQIKEVLSTQEMVTLTNEDGDEVVGYLDAVVRWVDDRIVVVDHKTAAREYDWDAVLKSPQLSLYMHSVSEKYENTRTAGYIVLRKNLDKNRTKVCCECKHNGTGSRAKSCDNTKEDGKRCGGEWIERITPEGRIDVLINEIPHRTEEIVMENMAEINHMIKQGIYTRNMNACSNPFPCQFAELCFKNDASNLIQVESKRRS
jgi:hypothetical protein